METFLLSSQSTIYTWLFLGTMGGVALWESLAPRRRLSNSLRLRWRGNFGLLLINTAAFWILFPGFGIGAALVAAHTEWGLLHQVDMPYWLAFLIAIVIMDLGHYAVHFALHRVPLLWRIHRLHHTDQDFDFTTGVRFHPLEAVIEQGAKLGVIAMLGPPVVAVALFEFAYVLTTSWVHGNIRMPANLDRRLRTVVITPDMHRTHHSNRVDETESNYGGLFSFWDRLFGNYVDEPRLGHTGMTIGIDEFHGQRHLQLGWMLVNPVLDAKIEKPPADEPVVAVSNNETSTRPS